MATSAPPSVRVRPMVWDDVQAVVALQAQAFPDPFDPALLWTAHDIECHLRKFPEGQWVAVADGLIVGSCSNVRLAGRQADQGATWHDTVGGPTLEHHQPEGAELYGLDISVHPEYRRQGVGRALYEARFALVRECGMDRYVTAGRMPDLDRSLSAGQARDPRDFATMVVTGTLADRTLTPLLAMGLRYLGTKLDYMPDPESRDAAALLEWRP